MLHHLLAGTNGIMMTQTARTSLQTYAGRDKSLGNSLPNLHFFHAVEIKPHSCFVDGL